HNAVLNTIMDHFYEVAGAIGATMQVTLFGRPGNLFAAWRASDIARARGKCGENRIQVPDGLGSSTNHHAIPALQAPYAATCTDVHILNLAWSQFLCAPYVVDVVRIASVNQDIFRVESRGNLGNH